MENLHIHNLWQCQTYIIIDVRLMDTDEKLYFSRQIENLLESQDKGKEKKNKYIRIYIENQKVLYSIHCHHWWDGWAGILNAFQTTSKAIINKVRFSSITVLKLFHNTYECKHCLENSPFPTDIMHDVLYGKVVIYFWGLGRRQPPSICKVFIPLHIIFLTFSHWVSTFPPA